MFTPNQFLGYLDEHRVIEPGRRYIRDVRNSEPSRMVSPSRGNLATAFASTKMSRVIHTESRMGEFAYARDCEHRRDVHEFWDQPQPVPVVRDRADGRTWKGTYTADFLVLAATGPIVVQVKRAEEIELFRSQGRPDWDFQEDGPHDVAADRAFALLGLSHVIVSTASMHPLRTSNLGLLLRAARTGDSCHRDLTKRVQAKLTTVACCTLSDLGESIGIADLTPLLQMIERGELHARLSTDSLAYPKTAWVSRDARYLEQILPEKRFVVPDTGEGVVLPSAAAIERALVRQRELTRSPSSRKRRRLRRLVRKGATTGKTEFDSLIPDYKSRGNRSRRLNNIQLEVLRDCINRFYKAPPGPNLATAYRQYVVDASEKHPEYRPVSITSFREHILQLPPEEVGMGRGGKRLANAMTGPSPVDSRDVPATRAFERAAVDHSLLPMYVVLHQKGPDRIAVQPWVSALRCKFSGFILALWMSLLNPSAKTLAILYRRCIRTHERFPECIYSDNGSDLTSRFHTSFCAHVGADHSRIPVASPRFDEAIESLFCEMQTELLQTRNGNLALRASDRGVSKTHKAMTLADHTPEQLWTELDMFTRWHNSRITTLNGESPAERLHRSLQKFSCSGIRLSLSNELMISTAVDIREFKVDPKDGIRVNDRRYSCAALTLHRPARSNIQVRLDPENPHVVYAKINGAWHTCKSSGARMFETLDDIEKLAETTRLMEGGKYRKRVREASQRDLVRIINEYDALRVAKKEAPAVDATDRMPLLPQRTLFDQVRELAVEAPTEDPDEVFDYVLGP